MTSIEKINVIIGIVFTLCYSYQFFYIAVTIFKKKKKIQEAAPHKYAVLISARNEEKVIGQLIESIHQQDYPKEYIDIYVVADNCTDATASIASSLGAICYERNNLKKVGKGYALEYLLDRIREEGVFERYEGYFIIDADNLLDKRYIREMNKSFSAGSKILTSYRNSKNFGDNWISAGYALWFLRESEYLNHARMLLGNACAVSGTGFLVSAEVIEKNGGWKHFLLTEDIEFSIDQLLDGEKIGYCHDAILYDEQPVSFRQSWRQRLRWARGYLQVFQKYGIRLLKGIVSSKGMSCFDMTMTILPAIILTAASFLINSTVAIKGLITHSTNWNVFLPSLALTILNAYLLLFVLGGITMITERNRIKCSSLKKILYVFTFPFFMFTYIPISFVSLFKKVEWKPIQHNVSISVKDLVRSTRW